MTKSVILTGLRANNDLQIGNYFGAMLPIIDMAKTRASVLHNARLYAAAGLPLNDDNIHLYRQSYVPAHSELTWILDCFTGFGEMSRMTQFKDKSHKEMVNTPAMKNDELLNSGEDDDMMSRAGSRISVGLFNYPVLMAADILLYNAKYVPVGDDQTQHLEFARDIATRMNNRFGELFVVPEPVAKQHEFFGKDQGLRIMDLVNPTKKMSKSDETGKGVIFLGDSPEVAAKKIMSATTDDKASVNYNPAEQSGISNLLDILALLRSKPVAEVAAEFAGMERYGDFKKIVASEIQQFLTDFQSRLATVDDAALMAKLESSEHAMNEQAGATLYRVQQAVGLRPKGN